MKIWNLVSPGCGCGSTDSVLVVSRDGAAVTDDLVAEYDWWYRNEYVPAYRAWSDAAVCAVRPERPEYLTFANWLVRHRGFEFPGEDLVEEFTVDR